VSKAIGAREVIDTPVSVTRSPYQFSLAADRMAAKGTAATPSVNSTASINGGRAQSTAFVIDGASTTHIGGIGNWSARRSPSRK